MFCTNRKGTKWAKLQTKGSEGGGHGEVCFSIIMQILCEARRRRRRRRLGTQKAEGGTLVNCNCSTVDPGFLPFFTLHCCSVVWEVEKKKETVNYFPHNIKIMPPIRCNKKSGFNFSTSDRMVLIHAMVLDCMNLWCFEFRIKTLWSIWGKKSIGPPFEQT